VTYLDDMLVDRCVAHRTVSSHIFPYTPTPGHYNVSLGAGHYHSDMVHALS